MNFNKFSIFKLPNTHRRFDYQPRHYDPKKEALEKKIAESKREKNGEPDGNHARRISFRDATTDRWGNSSVRSQFMMANVRLLVILAVMILVFYIVFKGLDVMGPTIDRLKNK